MKPKRVASYKYSDSRTTIQETAYLLQDLPPQELDSLARVAPPTLSYASWAFNYDNFSARGLVILVFPACVAGKGSWGQK